jgi:mutator protein MutT
MKVSTAYKLRGTINEAKTPLRIGVGALIMNKDGRICAISRKNNTMDLGLPGGKVDPGETEDEALKRELREELGIKVKKYHRLFASPDECGYWFITYFVYDYTGRPHDAEKKGAIVTWVPPLRMISPFNSFAEYNFGLLSYLGLLSSRKSAKR